MIDQENKISIKPTWEHLSHGQIIALSLSVKVSALLSIVGSSIVTYQILAPHKRKVMLRTLYHRIVLTISSIDIVGSVALLMSTWPIPKDTLHDDWIWGNIGNQITCNIQGYFIQSSGVSVAISTTFLCIYFMLLIRYNWSEQSLRKVEWMMRLTICLVFVGSLFPLFYDSYNPTLLFCWINSYPINCDTSEEYECLRGENAIMLRFLLLSIPIVLCVTIVIVTMSLLYISVKKQERLVSGYRSSRGNQSYSRVSRKVFVKVAWYIGTFSFIWIPPILIILIQYGDNINYWFLLMTSTLNPLQGFFNAIIFNYERLKNTEIMRRSSFLRLRVRGSTGDMAS